MSIGVLKSELPAAVCGEVGDGAQGAEGPLRATVGQVGRVTVGRGRKKSSMIQQLCIDRTDSKLGLKDRPDFEEVVERGMPAASQNVLIF